MEILEGIASFNGKLEEFREKIKQDIYQEILGIKEDEYIFNSNKENNNADKNEENITDAKIFQNIRNESSGN